MAIFFREEILGDPTCTDVPYMSPECELGLTDHISYTGVSVNLGIWCVLESAIIIIAACLPPVWPVVARILPQRLTKRKRDRFKRSGKPGEVPGDIPLKRTINGFSRLGESDGSQGRLDNTDTNIAPER